MDYIYYAIGWAAYYTIHSILAADQCKEILQKKWIPLRWYRLFFNGAAIVLMFIMVLWHSRLDKGIVFETSLSVIILGVLILLLGGYIALLALGQYNLSEFSGTVYLKEEGSHDGELNINGLNAHVRHPLYLATFLMVWGLWIVIPSWVLLVPVVVTSFYIPIGVYFEEKKLIKVFGSDYIKYKAAVPMLFPRLSRVFSGK